MVVVQNHCKEEELEFLCCIEDVYLVYRMYLEIKCYIAPHPMQL